MATNGRRSAGRWAAATCAALLAAFAVLAWTAARTKSPTMDEPTHAVAGWLALHDGNYRFEVANPALWKMWAAVGNVRATVATDRTGDVWRPVTWLPRVEVPWVRRTLFDTPGNDGGAFVSRSRAMMLVVGVALGGAIAAWAYRLAGPAAAVTAAGLFAFDPTFLAHAPLVKSDVAESLALLAVGWAAWRLGRRATVGRAAALGLLGAVAVNVKFAGLIAGPMGVALLATRAMSAEPWAVGRRAADSRGRRLAVAGVSAVVAGVVGLGSTWAVYRFRYQPAVDPAVAVDMAAVTAYADREGAGPLAAFATWADRHRLLPQAFSAGLLNQAGNLRHWDAFLDGDRYDGGRWQYYPLAAAYKTPVAELAAFAMAAAVGVAAGLSRAWRRPGAAWAAVCLGLPAAAFGAAALTTPLNVGLRNVLPLYAYADVTAGCAAAWAWRRWPRATVGVAAVVLGSMAVTAGRAWPDYLPFFNAAVGDARAERDRLADANLDWGQDVPALVQWQRAHPDAVLYADLFTSVEPAFYGLRYHKLWERTAAGRPELHLPTGRAVLAVSATHLQGLYVDPDQRPLLGRLARTEPRAVLHGTIYLYDYGPATDGR